jgi:serine/threonine protein kinase/Tol biopolymer transport system component
MGEVYKAKDTRLDRIVAIKVLPSHVSDDPALRERFEREAKAVAALNHPHICTLHDVGRHEATDYLVLEYLEGQTLADRLTKGALPLDQALTIAIQIADALDKAHRAGIVHRDLKPGNIMLVRRGGPSGPPDAKLLDFGLAKAATSASVGVSGFSIMPTAQAPVTAQGTILGTLQYMAPEQIEGQETDARTDIFAFGAVVYEMLTGTRAFQGKSQASLIVSILEHDPPAFTATHPLIPSALDRTVRRCVAKEPDGRWQTARDLLEELKWIAAGGERSAPLATPSLRQRDRVAWLVAAISLVAAIVAIAIGLYVRPAAPELMLSRLDVVTPPTSDPFSFALSHDGRQLAFVGTADGISRLWVRPLDQATARPIVGTEGASYPFWSPDGRAIGFFSDGKLKRVDVAGGLPQVLADVPGARGGTWNRDGVIVFAPQQAGLMQVAATGGTPTVLTHLAAGQGSHRWPQFLPDGRRFLFFVGLGQVNAHGIYLGSLDGRTPTRVLAGETAGSYASPGYVLRVEQGILVAHQFDAESGLVSPEAVPVAEAVGTDDGTFHSALSVSDAGIVAHRSGGVARRRLVWVDRTGTMTGVVRPPDDASLGAPELAPDGRRVAVNRAVQGNFDSWLIEAARGTATRFTFDAANEGIAVWSPDSSRLVFASARNGKWDLFEKPANGATDEQPLLVTARDKVPLDWSPDGQVLLYTSQDPKTGLDLWALPLAGERKPVPIVQTQFDERQGQFSPDGRWMAYVSNETGSDEIYIRPFPGPGSKWQVSTTGGIDPRWRRDGQELFYVAPDGKLMAVPIQVTADSHILSPGTPIALFPTRFANGANITLGPLLSKAQYAVARDGRFLMNVAAEDTTPSPITLVLNWATVLKK